MPEKNTYGVQPIVPMIAYKDGGAAIDWLVRAFGFREVTRMSGDDGCITHAQLELGGGMIMLASPTPHYQSPRRHREQCEPAREWVNCFLDCRLPWYR